MESLDDGGKARKRKLAAPGDGTSNDSGGDKGGTLTSADIATLLEKHTRQLDERVRVQSDRLEAKNAALEEECRSLQLQIHELNTDNARVREDYRARCDFLERSIQVLKKDVNWTYSAPDIPRSHWIEQGYDEDVTWSTSGTGHPQYYVLVWGITRGIHQFHTMMHCCPTSRNWQTPFKYQEVA